MNNSSPYEGKSAFGLFTNNKLEIYSFYALAVLGILFRTFFNQENDMTGNHGPATSTLWGYGISTIALFCILFIMYGMGKREVMDTKNLNPDVKDGFFSNILYILGSGNIIFVTLIVFAFILTLNYSFYQKINIGIIPLSFDHFNKVFNILMIVQFIILFQFINIRMFGATKNNQVLGVITSSAYFLTTINVIFVIIMYILLKYFSTDG